MNQLLQYLNIRRIYLNEQLDSKRKELESIQPIMFIDSKYLNTEYLLKENEIKNVINGFIQRLHEINFIINKIEKESL